MKAFAELIELQQKASLANHELGLRELETTRRMMIGLALVAIVAGLAIATSIIRALTGQLGGEPDYAKDVAVRIAGGDLASPIHVRAGDTRSVLWAMQAMRDNLRTLVGQVVAGAHTVSDSSAQLAQANIDLSQRTEEQASTLEETASSLEELTSTVTQNAQNARQATQSAANASDIARKGGIVVGEVVATMNDISQSSRRISEIISVIDGIAFQTNILALNAAVEAARAGEQGRGFAVVAAEVRNLAQRSAAAAKEIKELIGESVDKVVEGTKLVDAAGKTMQEIVASVRTVTDLITEIASASQEQSAGIEQVNTAVAQMDHAVQQNASLVEEAAAATEAMALQAETLLGTVTQFKLGARSEPTERVATAFVPRPIVVLPRAADSLPAPARHGEPSRAQPTAGDAWRTF